MCTVHCCVCRSEGGPSSKSPFNNRYVLLCMYGVICALVFCWGGGLSPYKIVTLFEKIHLCCIHDKNIVSTSSTTIMLLLNLSAAQEIEKYMSVHRKGHRKPRLSEPLVATLKQNVQSPIRIIRPSPTPISPSYKAKAQTNVNQLTHTHI